MRDEGWLGPDGGTAALELRDLGPIAIVRDGTTVDLGGARPRTLVAALAAAGGRPVSVARLVDEVWDDEAPASAVSTLASYVSRLRRRLDRPGTPPAASVLPRDAGGYALLVALDRRDSHRFRADLARGRRLLDDSRFDEARAALVDALAWWTEEPVPLDELPSSARADAIVLREERLVAQELEMEAALALGLHAEVLGRLEGMVAEHPYRERVAELLALARYRSGQQVEALDAVRSVLHRLDDHGGIEPRPELRALEHAILVQDQALDLAGPAPMPVDGPPSARVAASEAVRRAPSVLSGLVGRDAALAEVEAQLASHRLVTLWGPGGTGKTRLAIEVATRAEDAAWAALAEVPSADLVDRALATAIGATVQSVPSLREQLVTAARRGPGLLVIDNAEHVIDAVGAAIATLLDEVADVAVLVTSRTPLGLAGERLVELAPLDLVAATGEPSPAAQLFLDRATAVAPGWVPDALDRQAIDELCRRLDGLPLAVELAAARVRELAPSEILEGFAEGGHDLLGGAASPTPHHRSIDDAIRWSHDLLDDADRRLFRTLAVFDGDFDLATAAAVAGSDVVDGAARLSASSLLVSDRNSRPRRYRLLNVLRAWARARTDEAEAAELRHRLAVWAASTVHELGAEMRTVGAGPALARVERDRANLRGGVRGELSLPDGDPQLVLAAAIDLEPYFHRTTPSDGVELLGLALDKARADGIDGTALVGRGLLAQTQLSWATGDLATGAASSAAAMAIANEVGDARTEAIATAASSFMVALTGDVERGLELVDRASELAEALTGRDRAEARANAWVARAVMVDGAGRSADALDLLDRAAPEAREADRWTLLLAVAFYRGRVALRLGRPALARQVAADAALLAAEIGVEGDLIEHLLTLAGALVAEGDLETGAAVERTARARADDLGLVLGYADPAFGADLVGRIRSHPAWHEGLESLEPWSPARLLEEVAAISAAGGPPP